MIRRVAAVLLLCFTSASWALTDTHSTWWTGTTTYYDSADAACRGLVETSGGRIYDSVQNMSGVMPTRTAQCYGHTGTNAPAYVNSVSESCAGQAGWTQDATLGCKKTVATCPAPKTPDANGVCQNPTCAAAGVQLAGSTSETMYEIASGQTAKTVCIAQCGYKGLGYSGAALGHAFVWGPFVSLGSACAGTGGSQPEPTTTGSPSPTPLQPGTCSGTVNGATVVVPCTTLTAGGPSSSASSSSTGSGAPSSTAIGSESTTTCTNGVCTTTTTTTTTTTGGTGSGTTTSTGSTTQSQDDFCAANKGSKLCSGDDPEKSFSGTCSSTACSGDAIECAIAQEQARRWCQVMDAAPGGDPAVQAAAAGDQPSWHPAKNGQSVSLGSGFDQTNIVSGSCPADQTIQVSHFTPVVIAFSKLCQPAEWLGNILVGLTALACLGIVFVRGS